MTAQNIQQIIKRLDAQDEALHKIEQRAEVIEKLQRETNGRVREQEIWRARVEGAMSVGRNPIIAAVASGVAVAAIITLLHIG